MAARYLGMDSHLILRNTARGAESDPGLTGNLLVGRLVGAHIHQVEAYPFGALLIFPDAWKQLI